MASHGIHSNFGDLQAVRDAAADANVNLGGVTAFGPHQFTFNISKQMFEEMMQPNYETSVQMVWHYHGTLLQDSSKVFLFEPLGLAGCGWFSTSSGLGGTVGKWWRHQQLKELAWNNKNWQASEWWRWGRRQQLRRLGCFFWVNVAKWGVCRMPWYIMILGVWWSCGVFIVHLCIVFFVVVSARKWWPSAKPTVSWRFPVSFELVHPVFFPMRAAVSPPFASFAKVYRSREGFTKAEFAELQARIPKQHQMTSSITESIREKLVDTIDIARYLSFAKSLKSLKPIDWEISGSKSFRRVH